MYFSFGKQNTLYFIAIILGFASEITGYFQEKTDRDVKIYYVDCAVTFSNITDVRNFHKMPIDEVPEHVFCAFKCMGDAVDLTENAWIEGEICPNRLIMFPALHYEEGYDWDTYNKAEDCLRTLLDAPIKTCWDYKRVMACIPASMFRTDL